MSAVCERGRGCLLPVQFCQWHSVWSPGLTLCINAGLVTTLGKSFSSPKLCLIFFSNKSMLPCCYEDQNSAWQREKNMICPRWRRAKLGAFLPALNFVPLRVLFCHGICGWCCGGTGIISILIFLLLSLPSLPLVIFFLSFLFFFRTQDLISDSSTVAWAARVFLLTE